MANTIVVDIVADTRKLVAGVNTTNQQLGKLNGTTSAISKGFGLITKALAAIAATKIVWGWITDLEKEQNAFDQIADNFGKSSDKIIKKVEELSEKFKVDDGDIAVSLNKLANSTTFRYKKLLPQITELVLLADNLAGGAGEQVEKYTNVWAKALRSGKAFDGSDLTKFGIAAKLSEEEQLKFKSLKTITDQVMFLYEALQEELAAESLKFTTAQEIEFEVSKLKDAIALILKENVLPAVLKGLQLLKTLLFYEDEDGQLKVRDEVSRLAIALGTLWTVGKLSALVTALTTADGKLVSISKTLKDMPSLFKGIKFSELGIAFGLVIKEIWGKLGKFSKGLIVYFLVEIGDTVLKKIASVLPKQFEDMAIQFIDAFFLPFNDPVKFIKSIPKTIENFWKGIKESIFNWAKAVFMMRSPSKVMYDLGVNVIQGFINAFNPANALTAIKNFFTGLLARMKTAIAETNWGSLGQSIVNGLTNGMRAISQGPVDFITRLAKNMKDTFKRFFNISSPSKVFAGYGKNLMQGLALGISGNQRLATNALNLPLTPSFAGRGSNITVNINAGIGTDPYEVGRYVKAALDKYSGVNGR
jgi:hypothetical protein